MLSRRCGTACGQYAGDRPGTGRGVYRYVWYAMRPDCLALGDCRCGVSRKKGKIKKKKKERQIVFDWTRLERCRQLLVWNVEGSRLLCSLGDLDASARAGADGAEDGMLGGGGGTRLETE